MKDQDSQDKVVALTCPLRGQWVSFRLVDENGDGQPYAGLTYQLHDAQGQTYIGALDNEGYARVVNIYCGPSVLSVSDDYKGGDRWYSIIANREKFPLTISAIQVAAERSPSGPRRNGKTYLAEERAESEKANFLRVEVSDFVEANKHLPDPDERWQPRSSPNLKKAAGEAARQPGVALAPNRHHVLEVKALRAYSPLLSCAREFCALDAYHLGLMSVLSYASFNNQDDSEEYEPQKPPYNRPGRIGCVLRAELACLKKPTLFDDAGPYHLLCEEVPYSKRLEIVPYDPERYAAEARDGWDLPEKVHFLNHKDTNTQAFITHNDKVVVVSIRGTLGRADILRDGDARQVPYAEGEGQAHRGFYESFLEVKKFITTYLKAFHQPDHTLIVCGHSLGGAIALLLAEWLRREWSGNVLLYTFGAPRAGDKAFVEGARQLVHHRLVNHNDPIPAMPFTWMDAEWKLALPGSVLAFTSPQVGIALLLAGLLNLHGDPYQHHGEQRYFMPRKPGGKSEVSILWKPGCAALDEQTCALYAAAVDLKGDEAQRVSFIGQLFSMNEHSSNSGYTRAALTTLLHWRAALERDGELFTPAEKSDIAPQITHLDQQLAGWEFPSYSVFRWRVRQQQDTRFYRMTEVQLQAFYQDGKEHAERLRVEQRQKLSIAQQRLLAEAKRVVTPESVFGELSQHPGLDELLQEWLGQREVRKAEEVAAVSRQNSGMQVRA
ncbi:lipase family protein [Pseudomonas schmalbachii]|uniref:Lipase family protein n=1 Tax=Pseudomonas schmalbachii TaxID=2816993 RepID=A0ABS3TM65_9PSED|nr:lipase family protein [Pseudomonas schmalbachii]MBO3274760.1 lipase family protein [Pseudomonas schmalbachii]